MNQKPHKSLNQDGFASIVIALILIIVLALLTVGFAQLARREQKSALNKQLSSQAYYAAESGVNDTVQQLPAYEAAPPPNAGTGKCLNSATTAVNSSNGVFYTCVILNLNPPNILFDNIQAEQDRYITSDVSQAADSLTVSWGSIDSHTSYAGNAGAKFTSTANWGNQPAVLEFTLTPLNGISGMASRAAIDSYTTDHAFTVFLYPTSNGNGGDGSNGSIAYTTVPGQTGGNNGAVLAAKCNTGDAKYPCQATITGLSAFGTGPYLFHIVDHYDASNVSINGQNVLHQPINFDGQVQIDSTGQAHEVLKRIQVRVPRTASYDIPKDALEAQSICKRFSTDPVSGTQPQVGGITDPGGSCQLN